LNCSDEEDEDDDNAAGDDDLSDKGADTIADPDSGYSSDETDVSMEESGGEPAQQDYNTDEHGEPTRACKALCYEDIILWVVRNPQKGGRDILAMEVFLRHHKGVDNKPKPYAAPRDMSRPS
jgi:hypothetical protein